MILSCVNNFNFQASASILKTAKHLVVTPKDPPTWQLLANQSKSASESIKKLVASIRYNFCIF